MKSNKSQQFKKIALKKEQTKDISAGTAATITQTSVNIVMTASAVKALTTATTTTTTGDH